uniref:Uncharacterized protein n=1 Tax=Oryza rufipogon TaxID=4529 RepID=A0A0E0P7J2_ORYRU
MAKSSGAGACPLAALPQRRPRRLLLIFRVASATAGGGGLPLRVSNDRRRGGLSAHVGDDRRWRRTSRTASATAGETMALYESPGP